MGFGEAVAVGSVLTLGAVGLAVARTGTLLWSLDACVKFVASFLKRSWQLADYPVHLRRLPPDLPTRGNPLGETWVAYIENSAVEGFGPTPDVARQALASAFRFHTSVYDAPRPGLRWQTPAASGELGTADPQVFL
jgi:hypothetical protein